MVEEREGATPDRPINSRRRKAVMLFVVAFLVTVGSGAFYWWYRQTHISTDDAFVEGRIHPVAARIPGTVVEVLVEDNQPVKTGDPLLRIGFLGGQTLEFFEQSLAAEGFLRACCSIDLDVRGHASGRPLRSPSSFAKKTCLRIPSSPWSWFATPTS